MWSRHWTSPNGFVWNELFAIDNKKDLVSFNFDAFCQDVSSTTVATKGSVTMAQWNVEEYCFETPSTREAAACAFGGYPCRSSSPARLAYQWRPSLGRLFSGVPTVSPTNSPFDLSTGGPMEDPSPIGVILHLRARIQCWLFSLRAQTWYKEITFIWRSYPQVSSFVSFFGSLGHSITTKALCSILHSEMIVAKSATYIRYTLFQCLYAR